MLLHWHKGALCNPCLIALSDGFVIKRIQSSMIIIQTLDM